MAAAALLIPRTFYFMSLMESVFPNSKLMFFYQLVNCKVLAEFLFVPLVAAFEVFVYQNTSG